MTNTHMIRLDDATYERLRLYAFQRHLSFGKAVSDLLDVHAAATAPRSPAEQAELPTYTDAPGNEH